MQPYKENKIGSIINRVFDSNVNESELTWHRDREDRIVLPLNESDWYLQMDNELPVRLKTNEEYYIPKNTYHRVIKGKNNLKVQIIETTFEDGEYEVYEVLEEGKKNKKKTKKDACYYKVKSRYDVWPSAYSSGALVQCRKVGAKNWGNSTDESIHEVKKKKVKTDYSKEKEKGLHGWFERRGGGWVDCNTCREDSETGRKKCKPCGRKEGEKRAKYPACRPTPKSCETKGKGEKWGKKSVDEAIALTQSTLERNIANLLHSFGLSQSTPEYNKYKFDLLNFIKEKFKVKIFEHKINIFAENLNEMENNEVKTLPKIPTKKPVTRKQKIWEVRPASNPNPKM